MAGKRQVVVPGGIRKVIQTGGSTSSPGTTIAELGATTVSLAQLRALLGITTPAAGSSGSSGGSTASIIAGAGLLGGGPVVGTVPLYLAQSTPPVVWNDALLPDDFVVGATNVVSSSGPVTGVVLIGKSVAASAVPSLTVSGIPGTYTALQVIVFGQSDTTNAVEMCLTFNGDTGSHYDYQYLQGWSSNAQAAGVFNATFGDVGTLTASNVSTPGSASTIIASYANTTTNKIGTGTSALFISSLSANFAQTRTIVWHPSTPAAITSVTVTAQTGNIAAGGFMAVYGIP